RLAHFAGQPVDDHRHRVAGVVAILEIKYKRIQLLPPVGKQKHYSPLEVTVIHACEQSKPKNRKRIDWKLITDLPVRSLKDAVEKLQWYALRWKIELFHKILKSGCKAEESKLRTAERLVNLISIFCIVSWRIFWMTMLNRTAPNAPPTCRPNKKPERSPGASARRPSNSPLPLSRRSIAS